MNTVDIIKLGAYCQILFNPKRDFRVQLVNADELHVISVDIGYPIIESIVLTEVAFPDSQSRAWVGYCRATNTLFYQEHK